MKQTIKVLRNTFIIRGMAALFVTFMIIGFSQLSLYKLFLLFCVGLTINTFSTLKAAETLRKAEQEWHSFAYEVIPSILAVSGLILLPYLPGTGITAWHIMIGWGFCSGFLTIESAFSIRKLIEEEVILLIAGISQVLYGLWFLYFYISTPGGVNFLMPMIMISIIMSVTYILIGLEHNRSLPQLQ